MEFKLDDFERAAAALISLDLGPGVEATVKAALHLISERAKIEEEERARPSTVHIEELDPDEESRPSRAQGVVATEDGDLPLGRESPIPARCPTREVATQTEGSSALGAEGRWEPLFLRQESENGLQTEWSQIEGGLKELEDGWDTLRSLHYAVYRSFDEFRQGPGREAEVGDWPEIVANRRELARQIAAIRRSQRGAAPLAAVDEPSEATTGGLPLSQTPAAGSTGSAAPSVVIQITNSEHCSVPINIVMSQGGQGGGTGARVTTPTPRTPKQMGLPRGDMSLSDWEGCRVCQFPGVTRSSRCPRQELHELIGRAYQQGFEQGSRKEATQRSPM